MTSSNDQKNTGSNTGDDDDDDEDENAKATVVLRRLAQIFQKSGFHFKVLGAR